MWPWRVDPHRTPEVLRHAGVRLLGIVAWIALIAWVLGRLLN